MAGRQQFLVVTISVYCAGASHLQQLQTGASLIERWMIERCVSETISNFQGIKGRVSARAMVGKQVVVADHAKAEAAAQGGGAGAEPSWNPVR
ncbi:hypothetical protein DFJ73DRAFT_877416, partial [Zopfochytrium polystomum]